MLQGRWRVLGLMTALVLLALVPGPRADRRRRLRVGNGRSERIDGCRGFRSRWVVNPDGAGPWSRTSGRLPGEVLVLAARRLPVHLCDPVQGAIAQRFV